MPKMVLDGRTTNPNHGRGRKLADIRAIVLHETEGYNGGDQSILSGKSGRVSVHYWIPDYDDPGAAKYVDGDRYTVFQYLPLATVGWSVGAARPGYGNADTVSIELGNYKSERYSDAQLAILDQLIAHVDAKLGRRVPIVSHAEIALPKGRKSDPGPSFPMKAYKTWRAHVAPATPPSGPVVQKRVARPLVRGLANTRTDAEVVARLRLGTVVDVIEAGRQGTNFRFDRCRHAGRLMWIRSDYLK